jgi:propanediol dehydratase small subunit
MTAPIEPDALRALVRELVRELLSEILAGELAPPAAAAAAAPAARASTSALAAPAPGPVRIERGALTERIVVAAAREGRSIRVAPGVVATPLARDRARALGIVVEREEV